MARSAESGSIEPREPMIEARRGALEAFLAQATGAERAEIVEAVRLGGGAIQENWALELRFVGGRLAGSCRLVLRTDAPSRIAPSHGRIEEFRILEVAWRAGVKVPEPIVCCTDPGLIGRPFYVMRHVAGEARGIRIVRDPLVRERSDLLLAELARQLALIHTIRPPRPELDFLSVPEEAAPRRIREYRAYLDSIDAAEPVLEYALRCLERNAPESSEIVLTHTDFRTGNFLVEQGRLAAILDWEFASWSDPVEDLGWFCARCWRFGAIEREAGGIGGREAVLRAYEEASGRHVDPARLLYWETMATLRWAVIALLQAERHRSGAEPSLELALTAHLLPGLEQDLLEYLAALEAT